MAEYRLHPRPIAPTNTDGGTIAADAAPRPLFVWGHGWGQNGAAMMALASRLSFLGEHVCVDFPGFGEAAEPQAHWSVPDYVADLQRYLDAAHPGQPIIYAGHSFGARVGVRLAAADPQRVAGLILLGAAGLKPRRSLADRLRVQARIASFKALRALAPNEKAREALRRRFGSADYAAASALMRQVLARVVADDVSQAARAMAAPTLILCGEHDTETPPAMSRRLHALIAGSQLHVLPEFGHWDLLTRGAAQLSQMIREFTAGLDANDAAPPAADTTQTPASTALAPPSGGTHTGAAHA